MAKRYSEFKALRDRLKKQSPTIRAFAFPKKTFGSGVSTATVGARASKLNEWTNEVTKVLADDAELEREVCMFLAADDSMAELEAEDPAECERIRGELGEPASEPPPLLSARCFGSAEQSMRTPQAWCRPLQAAAPPRKRLIRRSWSRCWGGRPVGSVRPQAHGMSTRARAVDTCGTCSEFPHMGERW